MQLVKEAENEYCLWLLYMVFNIGFPLTTNDFLILSQNETQTYI